LRIGVGRAILRAHKKHIYTKLNINSQSELFALFYEAGHRSANRNRDCTSHSRPHCRESRFALLQTGLS
jgi:hypothetical protein